MKFGNLLFLWLLVLLPIVWTMYSVSDKRRKKSMEAFAEIVLLDQLVLGRDLKTFWFRRCLWLASIIFICLSLIQPKWGYHWEEVKRLGIDMVIAVDVSKSMLAEDVKPNRIERAKLEIKNLINGLRGDRIGIVAFAGSSFLQCPLTLDYSTVKIFLDAVDTDLIPEPGTDLGGAIEKSIRAFEGGENQQRVLILITDGEDHGDKVLEMIDEARKKNVVIYPIGIGSQLGAPIPISTQGGTKEFLKDQAGKIILSKTDSELLLKIALSTGGKYGQIGTTQFPLEDIYHQEIQKLEKKELGSARQKKYENRYQWPLTLALLCLLLEFLLGLKKRVIS